MDGTTWTAEAPVPITATRRPARGTEWSQRAVWKTGPAKSSIPSISGSRGSHSAPTPRTRTLASYSPAVVLTAHRPRVSSKRAAVTSTPNLIFSRTPVSWVTRRM